MKQTRHMFFAYTMAAVVLFQSFAALGCGGNSSHEPNLNEVSETVATAHTPTEMHAAFGATIQLVGYDKPLFTGQASKPAIAPEVLQGYEQLQLGEPESAYPTFSQAYSQINDNPSMHDIKLGMTADQVIAHINERLPAAYADRGTPDSALLVLLSSRPGAITATAPIMTSTMRLSPLQRFVLPKVLAQLLASRGICEIGCYAAYYATLGLIGALVAECSAATVFIATVVCVAIGALDADLALLARNACLKACHNQGGAT